MNSVRKPDAFTLVELLVVIAIIGLLAALLLPAINSSQLRAKRIACESQLRQLGIAFQSFSHDHNGKFPMAVPAAEGGSLEFTKAGYLVNGPFYFSYRHFQSLVGIIDAPKILVCPADTRWSATNFASLQNSNLSYFVGVTASFNEPMSMLAGDGNLSVAVTLLPVKSGEILKWTAEQHRQKGNVLFSDGHVEEWGNGGGSQTALDGDLVLPTLGLNTSHPPSVSFPGSTVGSQPPSSGSTNPAPSGVQPDSKPQVNPPPAGPAETPDQSAARQNHQSSQRVATETITVNSAPVESATLPKTNPPVQIFSTPVKEDEVVSGRDQGVARFFRLVFGWGYLLLLLLLLAYLIWRIRQWLKERERRRRRM